MATDIQELAPSAPPSPAPEPKPKERRWAPRCWLGGDFLGFMRLLARNRFAVHPALAYIAAIDTVVTAGNTVLRGVQNLVYGRRVARTELAGPPLFVIGHWRCGTTLLHELLVLDDRFTYPTSYACFAPNHFLLTERFADRWLRFLLPSHRPMDDMAIQWDSPQEDEFALCNLGIPSPYLTIAFPNHGPQYQEYLDLEGLPPRDLARWKQALVKFLKQITLKTPKRVVLKSPPHTCRIKVLQEMFPEAQFVHIVRDPHAVYSSTVNLWKRLYEGQGFQKPRYEGLEEHVLATFARMHDKLEQTRHLVDPRRFYELRYEDLVADPVGQLGALYDHLRLGGFERVAPAIERYTAARADYKPKRHQLTDLQRQQIAERWGAYLRKYGYGEPESTQPAMTPPGNS